MSPRLGPKSYAEHVDEEERVRAAAREFAADKEASLERASWPLMVRARGGAS